MNAGGQSQHIVVTGTDNNTGMRQHLAVQADKVPPIKRHHRSAGSSREHQDRFVCNTLPCLSCLVGGEEVVPKLPQALDHGITEISIGIE